MSYSFNISRSPHTLRPCPSLRDCLCCSNLHTISCLTKPSTDALGAFTACIGHKSPCQALAGTLALLSTVNSSTLVRIRLCLLRLLFQRLSLTRLWFFRRLCTCGHCYLVGQWIIGLSTGDWHLVWLKRAEHWLCINVAFPFNGLLRSSASSDVVPFNPFPTNPLRFVFCSCSN